MSRHYADLERELIDDLERRTGRDLAAWMAAIDGAALVGKNAVIDWLRPQGFTFANASWLERIHNNGGRPIYLDQPTDASGAGQPRAIRGTPDATVPAPRASHPTIPASDVARPASAQSAPPPPRRPLVNAAPPSGDRSGLDELLSRAKAYRPLAQMLLSEAERTLPGLAVDVVGDLVVLSRPRPLAVLSTGARDLKLALDLGERPFDAQLARAKLPGAEPRFTHVVALTDARQIGPALFDLLRLSDFRANPPPPGAEGDH